MDCGVTLKWQVYPESQKNRGLPKIPATYATGGIGSGAVLLSEIEKESR